MSEARSDPTIQLPRGPTADATGHWLVSLAEIDAMGRKAARGAGLAWGLAEEAGRAARWLAAYGQPGPEALLVTLQAIDGDPGVHGPDAGWCASAPLCPIRTGAALSDRAGELDRVRLGAVIEPVLLVPFLSRAARDLGLAFALETERTTLIATLEGPACSDWAALRGTSTVTVARAGTAGKPCPAGPGPWRVSVETWRRLERLAHRTYVPATQASRAGAGAGVRDTD